MSVGTRQELQQRIALLRSETDFLDQRIEFATTRQILTDPVREALAHAESFLESEAMAANYKFEWLESAALRVESAKRLLEFANTVIKNHGSSVQLVRPPTRRGD